MTQKDPLLYGVIGVLIGGIIVWFLAATAVNNNHYSMMQMMGMHASQNKMMNNHEEKGEEHTQMHSDSSMSMQDMINELKDKTGDDFDKAFMSEMIAHHQGAIDMAKLAKQNAKHDEIKNMADDIIAAQTKEINEMRAWQKNWGYTQ